MVATIMVIAAVAAGIALAVRGARFIQDEDDDFEVVARHASPAAWTTETADELVLR